MSANVGDVIRITLRSGYGNETFFNMFHYRVTNASSPNQLFAGIRNTFVNRIVTPLRAVTTTAMNYTQLKVENLSNLSRPFFEYPLALTGQKAGEAAPTFVAFQFKFIVGTRVTRAGFKRFGGVTEGDFNGNVWTGAFVSSMTVLTINLGNVIIAEEPVGTDVGILRPIVLGKYTTATPTPDDYQDVLFADFIDRPTTQNTRKVRGV